MSLFLPRLSHFKFLFKVCALLVLFGHAQAQNIPAGYYTNADDKTGYTLKTALHNIIKDHNVQTYASVWTHVQTTDKRADGKVWDMYSACSFTFVTDQDGGTQGTAQCQKYNREHALPASWFSDASPVFTDLFNLYPSDKFVNSVKSNHPLAKVGNATLTSGNGSKVGSSSTTGYSGTAFEPADEYKGDFARGYLYMATRYQNLTSGWSSVMLNGSSDKVFNDWAVNLLISWHEADPVSAKEIARNEAVYAIQGNRNPFVDKPEYVSLIWQTADTGANEEVTISYIQDFNECTNLNNWIEFSVLGDQKWECTNFGYNATSGVRMNGFATQSNANEDWLISTPLTIAADEFLSFYVERRFEGPDLEVKISNNYSGTGNPTTATWTNLPATIPGPAAANDDWKQVKDIALNSHAGANRYIAFVYKSTTTNSSRFTLDDVTIYKKVASTNPSLTSTAPAGGFNFGFVVAGNNSASQTYKISGANLTADIALSTTAPFQISLDNTTWNTNLTIPQGNANNSDVYVRYSPTAANGIVSNATITHSSTGSNTISINVSGTEGQQGVTTIKSVRDAVDANGIPTTSGTVILRGIVHGVNTLTGVQFQYALIDDTAGITIRNATANDYGTITEGDEIEVSGTINHFNGLMQLTVTSPINKLSSGNPRFEPQLVTQLDEDSESNFVLIEDITLVNPSQWVGSPANTASFNVDIQFNGQLYVMRIDRSTDISKLTLQQLFGGNTSNINIAGLGGQFDTSDPRTAGYQFLPYRASDISVGPPRTVISFEQSELFLIEPSTFAVNINFDKPLVQPEILEIDIVNGTDVTYGVGGDYRTVPAAVENKIMLNLTAGATSAVFVINVLDDARLEERETVVFSFGTLSAGLRASNTANTLTLTIIDNNPEVLNIKQVRGLTNQGRSVYENDLVQVTGIVHGVNTLQNQGLIEFRLIDTNAAQRAGLTVRKTSFAGPSYTVKEGDEVSVSGIVLTDKGLQYIEPTKIEVIASNKALATAIDVVDLTEVNESDLVRLSLMLVYSGWGMDQGGYYNVTLTDGQNQYMMRIDENTDIFGKSAPEAVSVTGFVLQEDQTAPFDGEYLIMPRYMADISFLTPSVNASISNIHFYPNPSKGTIRIQHAGNQNLVVTITDIHGKTVFSEPIVDQELLDLNHLQNGMYLVRIEGDQLNKMQKLIIKK